MRMVCYHRTDSENLEAIMAQRFKPGGGDLYGKGMYSNYALKWQAEDSMKGYGDAIVKFDTIIGKTTLILVPSIAKKVYGNSPVAMPDKVADIYYAAYNEILLQQRVGGAAIPSGATQQVSGQALTLAAFHPLAQLVNSMGEKFITHEVAMECIKWAMDEDMHKAPESKSSAITHSADYGKHIVYANNKRLHKLIEKGSAKIDSIVYFGRNDGACLVVYNNNLIAPVAYALATPKELRDAKGRIAWHPLKSESKHVRMMKLNILLRDLTMKYKGDRQILDMSGKEVGIDLEDYQKRQLHFMKWFLTILDQDEAVRNRYKKIIKKALAWKLINVKLVLSGSPMALLLAQYDDPEILETYFKAGGMYPGRNSSAESIVEICIKEEYLNAAQYLISRYEFNPNQLASSGEPLYVMCIRRNNEAMARDILLHPNFENNPSYLPLIKRGEERGNYAFYTIKGYLKFISENPLCPEDKKVPNIPESIMGLFKDNPKDEKFLPPEAKTPNDLTDAEKEYYGIITKDTKRKRMKKKDAELLKMTGLGHNIAGSEDAEIDWDAIAAEDSIPD